MSSRFKSATPRIDVCRNANYKVHGRTMSVRHLSLPTRTHNIACVQSKKGDAVYAVPISSTCLKPKVLICTKTKLLSASNAQNSGRNQMLRTIYIYIYIDITT